MKTEKINIEMPLYRFIVRKVDNGFTLSNLEELETERNEKPLYRQCVNVFDDNIEERDLLFMDDELKKDYSNTDYELKELCSFVRLLNSLAEKLDIFSNKYCYDIKIKKK